jgi:outer membrane protein assembly factor BamB
LVVKGVLMLPLENAGDSFVAGLDVRSGTNRWKVSRERGINWVSPLVMKVGDRVDVLFQSGSDLTAYDPETGKPRWTYKGGQSTIPSPVPGKDIILTPANGITALRPVTGKDEPDVLWENKKLGTQTGSPLFYDGRVYTINGGQILQCADAINGEILWTQRVGVKPYSASPVAGDGKIYCVNEFGVCCVVEVGAKPSCSRRTTWARRSWQRPPSPARGHLHSRRLWCIGVEQ